MKRFLIIYFCLVTGFIFSQTFSLTDTNVTKGKLHNLWSIHFELAQSKLLEACKTSLDSIKQFLINNPSAKIEIGAHTDTRGDAKKNIILSQARADEIKKYLIEQGISAERFVSKGYGSTKLFYSEKESTKNKIENRCEPGTKPYIGNRRVTVLIL